MQPRRLRLITDPHVSSETLSEPIDGGALGRTHVRRGQHTKRNPAGTQVGKRVIQHAQAMPTDEGTQQIDPISAGEFGAQLSRQRWLILGVRQ
jgi:hypothetical protein